MEWMNRGEHAPQGPVTAGGGPAAAGHGRKGRQASFGWLRSVFVVLLFSGTILIVALVLLIARGGAKSNESKYIDSGKYQAVFLNGGQVYFGKIKSLDAKYMRVQDIYYLRVNQQVQPNQSSSSASNDISLVKLGCELHGPQDQMQINREQIIFWENLKTDGQVAKAVAEYQKQNPDGQKCDTASASTSNGTGTGTGTGTSNSTLPSSTSANKTGTGTTTR